MAGGVFVGGDWTYGRILVLVPLNRSLVVIFVIYATFFKPGPLVTVPGQALAGNRLKINKQKDLYLSPLI
jgi:hypothetical protein